MTRALLFLAALAALSAAAGTTPAPPSGVPALPDQFDCGRYAVSGKLGGTPAGAQWVQVYPGTTRRFDLVLWRLDMDDLMGDLNHDVRAEVLIVKPGRGAQAAAQVQGHVKRVTHSDALTVPVKLRQKLDCAEALKQARAVAGSK